MINLLLQARKVLCALNALRLEQSANTQHRQSAILETETCSGSLVLKLADRKGERSFSWLLRLLAAGRKAVLAQRVLLEPRLTSSSWVVQLVGLTLQHRDCAVAVVLELNCARAVAGSVTGAQT